MCLVIVFSASLVIAQSPDSHYKFVENKGQWPDHVYARAELEIGWLYLEKGAFVFQLTDYSEISALHGEPNFAEAIAADPPVIRSHAYKQRFVGANENASILPNHQQQTRYNYFHGKDPALWAGGCRSFGRVTIQDFYPGIDLLVYSNDFFLKYDFVIKPGSDPSLINWKYEGGVSPEIEEGRLRINSSITSITEQKPVAWQIVNGVKRPVQCHYKENNGLLTFELPNGFDNNAELIIDPELIFSTYSGSTADNFGYTATYDSDGFLYSGSSAFGNGYPYVLGSFEDTWAGGDGQGSLVGTDIAISKYDTTGTFMVYSTYLGGSNDELPHSLVVDENDQLIVLGTSSSPDFPVTGDAWDPDFDGGADFAPSGVGVHYVNGSDIIVTKFNSDGSDLIGSTFLGGTGNDGLNTATTLKFNYADEMRGEVEVDPQTGEVYVVSCTYSLDFPVVGGFQGSFGGGLDGCVTKFDPSLQNIIWSSYLGGSGHDAAFSMALNSVGELYVCGGTGSDDFPIGIGPSYQSANAGGNADGYVVRLSQDGSTLMDGTFLGSPGLSVSGYDQLYFVELDDLDDVYVYGQTMADGNYFINNAAYGQVDSGMLVAKFGSDLSSLQWSTTIGTGEGKPNLSPTAFLVDICGKVYMSGWGGTTNVNSNSNTTLVNGMPTTADAYQTSTDGSDFYLIVLDNSANNIVYGSFFGGSSSAEHVDGGTSRFDKQGVIYQSVCAGCGGNSDFPIYPANAVSPTNNSPNCNNGVFKYKFELPPVLAGFIVPPQGCVDLVLQFTNTSVSATEYQWDFGDNSPIATQVHPIHSYGQPGTYTVQLIATNPICGFADTTYADIVIFDLDPSLINASANPIYISEGESSQLFAEPSGYSYTWSPAGTLDNPNIQNPLATPPVTTVYTVTVTEGPCSYSDTVKVLVDEIICNATSLYVPNAFSPNGDEENDVLFVRGVSISDLYFVIYDRWGELIFETTNQEIGWDGTFKGKDVDPAVFVYYLEVVCADGQEFFQKGNITVLR
jgi:gliding motility-associated-like protein